MRETKYNLTILVILSVLVVQSTCLGGVSYGYGHNHHERHNPTLIRNRAPARGRVQVEDDSVENGRDENLYPWRHHIDFDERHPGEDQIAVETRQDTTPHRHTRVPAPIPVHSNRGSMSGMFGPTTYDDSMEMETGDGNRPRSPFGMQVTALSDFFNPDGGNDWISMFGGPAMVPWWKGSNVCIKREEEDENAKENDSSESSETETIIPKSSAPRKNESSSESPGFHMKFSSCENLETKYSCVTKLFGRSITKTIRTDYECCNGYVLNTRKEVCERGRYENIVNTILEIGGKEFVQMIKSTGLDGKLSRENLTVFVPTDEAVANFRAENVDNDIETNSIVVSLEREAMRRRRSILTHSPKLERTSRSSLGSHRRNSRQPARLRQLETNESFAQPDWTPREEVIVLDEETWKRNALDQQDEWKKQVTYSHEGNSAELQKTLLSHMVEGKLSTDDFVDEKVIFTQNDDSVIRMNTWDVGGEKLKTVNCARLTSINHRCTNGMVHMIDRMIKPVKKSISDVVSNDPDLSTFKSLLETGDFLPMLRDRKQHLTLFAPTNAALNKMGSSFLTKMRSGDPCLKRIVRHHIIPITFCTSVIYKQGQVRNVDHDLLSFERKNDDKLFINGSQIVTRDIVTTNGVVHIIDAVILSDNDKPVTKALEKAGLSSFLESLSRVGLTDTLDAMTNITVFAPDNSAMDSIPDEIKRSHSKLREILLYHVASPELRACHFSHEQALSTKATNRTISMNLYSMYPFIGQAEVTAQCGRLTKVNTVSCNGMIHTVDRVLLPPDLNLIQTLKTQSDFSIFSRLLEESDLQNKLQGKGPLTVFAPTDKAFYALPRDDLEKILNDKNEAKKLIKKHILEESLCCAGVAPSLWFLTRRVETLSELHVPVFRDYKGQVVFGNSKVTTCDLTASNGIIHTIDSVLIAEKETHRNEYMGTCMPSFDNLPTAMFFRF